MELFEYRHNKSGEIVRKQLSKKDLAKQEKAFEKGWKESRGPKTLEEILESRTGKDKKAQFQIEDRTVFKIRNILLYGSNDFTLVALAEVCGVRKKSIIQTMRLWMPRVKLNTSGLILDISTFFVKHETLNDRLVVYNKFRSEETFAAQIALDSLMELGYKMRA